MSEKKYLTYREACELFGICRNTMMKYDRPGITVRLGRTIRFDKDALIKAVQSEGIENE